MKGGVNKVSIDNRVRFTLRLPNKLLNLIGEKSNEEGVSINSFILKILWEWVKEGERSGRG